MLGECVLFWINDIWGGFVGLMINYIKVYFICVILEGVVFNFVEVYEVVLVLDDIIYVIGGILVYDVWCKFLVDILNWEICVLYMIEGLSLGVVIIGMWLLGILKDFNLKYILFIKVVYYLSENVFKYVELCLIFK